jgi:hypothetical protein
MAKDTYYFSHDYNSRNDIKIKKLISKHGYLGYGLFWALIEELYNNTNVLRLDYETISFDLRCDIDTIKSIINDFDLFVFEGDTFGSLSVERRLNERNEKSAKARESVLKRWNKLKYNTNVLQTNNDSNTIKEKKRKKNKDEIIKKKISFIDSEIYDKNKFKVAFSEWTNDKLAYYYESALTWSNEGNKKIDWIATIRTWANRDEKQGKIKFTIQNIHNNLQGTL